MTLAYYCVLVAGLLPYVATLVAKAGAFSLKDNHNPREVLERRTGVRKRAHWAQLNGFEAFPFFAAAVLIAHARGAEQGTVDGLAVAFVGARVIYLLCYLADQASLRSLFWFAGFGSAIALFFV